MLDYNDHYSNLDHSSPYNRKVSRNKFFTDYAAAIELNPVYQNTYQHGWSYVLIGEYDRAIIDFTKLVKKYPCAPGGYYSRGWAYAGKGEYDRAIADFTSLINLNPDPCEAYYSRGEAYADKGDYKKAIVDFTRAIGLGDIYCHFSRGLAHAKIGNNSEAIVDFDVIVRLSGDRELIPKAKQEIEKLQT